MATETDKASKPSSRKSTDKQQVKQQVKAEEPKTKEREDNAEKVYLEDCNVKTQTRMTQCNLCMTWFYDQCVGVKKGDIVGWWCCGSCRQMLSNVSVMFECFRCFRNVQAQTIEFTKNITKQLSDISSLFSNRLQQLYERRTALANQNNGYASDLAASQTYNKNSL